MSCIYHQVVILAYKTLIKNICIINTPYGNKAIIISRLNMQINLIISYQGALKSNIMTRSYKYDMSWENNIKEADSDVLLDCGPSRCIKILSCSFILKPLVLLAKTEKSSKDTILLQTNIWSHTAKFLVDLVFLPVRAETPICSETRTLKWRLVSP